MKQGKILFFGLMIALLSGCASIGPGSVSRDRYDYVASITESWKRQIALNIIKIRYLEPIFFVDVGQIVAGYSLETGITLGGQGTLSNFSSSTFVNSNLSGKYTDRPTITYTPLTGSTFVKGLMTPISPNNLLFAIQSGVPSDMIFRLGVGSINGLRNESAGLGGYSPAEEKFLRVVDLIRRLQRNEAISIKTIKEKDQPERSFISFPPKTDQRENSALAAELRQLLGLDPAANQFPLVSGSYPENDREVAMQTFSLMHMLSFLAARVEVPEKDLREKRASPGARETIGKGHFEGFLMKSSEVEPLDAYVAVKYRNHWFWVDDQDLFSKRVMSFLTLMFTLADTGVDKPLPVVTIPAQ